MNSTRQLSFSWALNFVCVCGPVPLLSGPPDSPLTVRQRSRKMVVIHFVPCHRQGSFFPSAHYLQTRLCISAGHCSLPLWPRPTVLRGLGLVDDPLWILSAPPAIIQGTPLYLLDNCIKDGSLPVRQGKLLGKQGLIPLVRIKHPLYPENTHQSLQGVLHPERF